MVVHPAYANWSGTLVNGLMHYTQQNLSKKDEESLRPGIVHRLDKDTSGLLVVAKTDEAHKHLARQFADKETRRTYRSEEHTSELQSRGHLVCRLLLEKK